MSKEILRETLDALLGKKNEELESRGAAVRRCEEDVEQARRNLAEAKAQENYATHEDEYLRKQIKALNDHYTGCIEKPQVIFDEINRLNAQQSRTFDKVKRAHVIVERRMGELRVAESRLRMAQDDHQTTEKEYQDVLEQIHGLAR